MKRALPLLAALAGCSLRDARVTAAPSCANAGQCSQGDLCFLGECRPPSSNLSIVRVEVRPPVASQFGVKDFQLDLRQTVLNNFKLAPAVAAKGTISMAQDNGAAPAPVNGAVVTFVDHAPAIPDRIETIAATTDATGAYNARLPQGSWDVTVQPPAPLPPLRVGTLDTSAPVTDYIIPATSALQYLAGALFTDAGTPSPVAGAAVTAVNSNGIPLSASTISQADGGYGLYLPPGSPAPSLQIGPPDTADAGVASALPDPFPIYPSVAYAPSLTLSLPPAAALSGRVLDGSGNGVPGARVYVRSSNMGWVLSRTAVADASGAYSVALRQGIYLAQAAPPADSTSPALSSVQTVSLPSGAIDFSCPAKVQRKGKVLGPDGRPVGVNFQVVATRVSEGLVTTRTATASPTQFDGIYVLTADPGRWRLEVIPPVTSPLPRKIVQVDLDPDVASDVFLPAIQISTPLQVVGTVTGSVLPAADVAVPDAIVSFFAFDSGGSSVFLGSARADAQGHYTAILPDVAQPGAGP